MRWNEITTMENLWEDGCAEQGAVLKHGDRVLCMRTCLQGI